MPSARRLAWVVGFLGLTLTAVGITTARVWVLPRIGDLKHQLTAELSRRIGQPVRIGRLRASLHRLTPQLRLVDVRIGRHRPVRLQEIQVVPDLIASIRERRLHVQWLRILKTRIEIQQDREGRWHLRGLGRNGPPDAPDWLLRDGDFDLLDTTLILRRHRQPPLVWQGVAVSLSNREHHHRLQIRYRSPGRPAQRIRASVHFQAPPDPGGHWQGRFLVQLEQVAVRPLAALLLAKPVEGKGSAQFWGHFRNGRVDLTGHFDLHTLRWSHRNSQLKIDQASGTVRIRHSPRGWRIRADDLHLINRDLNLLTRFTLQIPEAGSPHLAALGRVFHLDLARIHAYLPAGASDAVRIWLRDRLKGTARGRFLWRGRPADFPFTDQSGITEARLIGHDVHIRFHPRWPAISRATVQLEIHNGGVRATLKQGKIAGIPIQRLSARLTLAADDPVLTVSGGLSAPLKGIVSLLNQSPLHRPVAEMGRWVDMKGKGRLNLTIRIPLRHGEDFRVDGRGVLQGPHIRLRPYPVTLEAFRGKLGFDRHTLRADLSGRIRRQPARLHLTRDHRRTRITLQTRFGVENWPELARIPGVTGTAPVDLALTLPRDTTTPPLLHIQSDLRGLGIHLPDPVGKKAATARPLHLHLWLAGGEPIPLTLDYPPFHAALQWHRGGIIDGRIGIHRPPPPPRHVGGLIVKGKLARLDLDPWWRAIQAAVHKGRRASVPGGSILGHPGRARPSDERPASFPEPFANKRSKKPFRLQSLELDVAQLSWHGHRLGRHRIRLQAAGTGWRGRVTAPYTQGRWRLQDHRLALQLDFLDLAFLRNRLPPSASAPAPLADWPAIRLDCKRLRWEETDLGQAHLHALPRPTRLRFDFRLQGRFHRLEGSGAWQRTPQARTQLSGRFHSQDLGRFLKALHLGSALAETPADIDFRLRYPAPPYGFSPGSLQGYLNLHMGPGRWLDFEPGAGRLLGLLYLGTLQRRLHLDFSDLFSRGLSYERIQGHIRLAGSQAFTDDLLIEAVPARIFISGTADLDKHEIDETVLVVPNTPLTLGVFSQRRGPGSVLQRLFNAPLDTLTQSQYAIYGSWDEPTIVRMHRSLPGTLLGGIWSGLKKLTTGKAHESGQRRRHPNEQRRSSAGQPAPGRPAHPPGG